MKPKVFNSIATKNGVRLTSIALAFVVFASLGAASGTAQSKKQKPLTSVRLGTANEGSRVTVVAPAALNDYEAYRRGDRFYVEIPRADFVSEVPNLRGAGFEDVRVQKTAYSSIISFRLQPGTAARVVQRSNRLDVVFSTPKSAENPGGTTTDVAGRAQNPSGNLADVAGSSPPSLTGDTPDRRDSSQSNPNKIERQSQSTLAPQSTVGSQQGSGRTASQANPAVSSPGANETASPSGTASASESGLALVSPGQPSTVEQQPAPTAEGTISPQNLPVRGRFAGEGMARNWLMAVLAALLLVALPILLVARRSRLKTISRPRRPKESLIQQKNRGNVGLNEPEFAALQDSCVSRVSPETRSTGAVNLGNRMAPLGAPMHQSVMEARFAIEQERLRLQQEALTRSYGEAHRKAEREIFARSEAEATLSAGEDPSFPVEAEPLRRAAEELARGRSESETARLPEGEARRGAEEEVRQRVVGEAHHRAEEEARRLVDEEVRLRAEEQTLLVEAEERRRISQERLKLEQEALMQAAIELTRRRAEVQEARRAEDEEARRLAQAQEQVRVEEERRHLVEEERSRVEAESQRRAQEERTRVEEFARLQAEEERRRLAELDLVREQAERQAQQRAEQEQRIRAEIEALRQAEIEQNKRIEVETRRKAAEESRHQAEQEARVHAALEAHPRAEEEAFSVPMDRKEGEETPHADKSFTGSGVAEKAVATSHQFPQPVEGIAGAQEKGLPRVGDDSSIPSEIFQRLKSNESRERAAALAELAAIGGRDVFSFVSRAFDDESADVRNAAAQALYDMQLDRAASFTKALQEGSPERRRRIGAALAASGLANNAINNLTGDSREKTYDAFSLLFLMAKAGEVQPLMRAIEEHTNVEVRLAVVKLLALSGQEEIVPAFRRLAVRGSLPSEVRSAVLEAIYQISNQARESAHFLAEA